MKIKYIIDLTIDCELSGNIKIKKKTTLIKQVITIISRVNTHLKKKQYYRNWSCKHTLVLKIICIYISL